MAFADDVARIVQSMRGRALRLCKTGHDADDLCQQTVLRALVAQRRFREGTNLAAWLNTMMTNIFLSSLQGRRFDQITSYVDDVSVLAHADPLAGQPEHRIDLSRAISVIAGMTPRQQAAVMKAMNEDDILPHERNSLAVARSLLRGYGESHA
jgi:DNA-directed RNA polymerase specialized sigma24 family protein